MIEQGKTVAEEVGTLEEVSLALAILFLLATILKVSHIRTGHPISTTTIVWSLIMFLILYTFNESRTKWKEYEQTI